MSTACIRRLSMGLGVATLVIVGGLMVSTTTFTYVLDNKTIFCVSTFLLLLPYLWVIDSSRRSRASRARAMAVLAAGVVVCSLGVLAWGIEAQDYHTTAEAGSESRQGFVPPCLAAIIQYAIVVNFIVPAGLGRRERLV